MEEFRHELQDTLTHLHDPDFSPSPRVYTVLGCDQKDDVAAVQMMLTHLIEHQGQAGELLGGGPSHAEWQVLQQRFVLKLNQEECAARLNMSVRTLQRVQRRAVYLLARYFWQQNGATASDGNVGEVPATEANSKDSADSREAGSDWQTQVSQELEALRQVSPDALSDVGISLERALTVGQAVASRRGVVVEVAATTPNLMAAIHPSALRHVLITAIEQMAQRMTGGKITLDASLHTDAIEITVKGAPLVTNSPLHSELMREIVATHGGTVEVANEGESMSFQIALPNSGNKVVVMVIDDNPDLVAFYRRYVAGTRYEIMHLVDSNRLFAAIEETQPAIIVLDVLLPDADGWELLTYLHEHPATRTMPILVASVVRGEELALALGVSAYLPKPVRRQQFIQVLDQLLERDRV